ncbi:MAG TPA: ribose 5-phosphate isomerase B [Clostridiales bacterium]|jgi:ribose 5-phosphate isomerase B|nr:ribose 5-phosphate isomerase B [Clostridiales bacterium]
MKIAIANDHAALELKNQIVKHLEEKGLEYVNFGTDSTESIDYPLFAYKAAKAVQSGECDLGIVICGTGIGISLAANKVPGIRCALCSEPLSASLTRQHNNANMLAMGARVIGVEMAKAIVDAFLNSEYEGGRHQRRVNMITAIEQGQAPDSLL